MGCCFDGDRESDLGGYGVNVQGKLASKSGLVDTSIESKSQASFHPNPSIRCLSLSFIALLHQNYLGRTSRENGGRTIYISSSEVN